MPSLSKDPGKLFSKVLVSKGYGFNTPQARSICKIKVINSEINIVLGLDEAGCKEIVIENTDEPIDIIIEDCIRTMKEKEECYIEITCPHSGAETSIQSEKNNSKNATNSQENTKCVKIHFQLLSYTKEPEIWEMAVTEKLHRAHYHKQRGMELYTQDMCQYAFRHYSLELKYLISLEQDDHLEYKEGMGIKELKFSCYLNIAACQMRHHNYEYVVINASKALNFQSSNVKALYRRGVAYLQLQEYEKAEADLTFAQKLEPKNFAIIQQLQILKYNVHKLNQYYGNAMKIFLLILSFLFSRIFNTLVIHEPNVI